MDSEKDINLEPVKKIVKSEDRCNLSEGSRMVNNRVNPFDTVGNYHERRLQQRLQKRNDGELTEVYNNIFNVPHIGDVTSNVKSAEEIRQKLIEDIFSNHSCIPESSVIYKQSDKSQPTFTPPTKHNPHAPAFAKYMPTDTDTSNRQVGFNSYDLNNRNYCQIRKYTKEDMVMDKDIYTEKEICCSPLQNMINEEFVLNTMQRYARLQKLVRKLVIERQKEKQREVWNNYINELKNKHRYYSYEPTRIAPQYVPKENESIDDFWRTNYSCQQPDTYQSKLNSLYSNCNLSNQKTNHPQNRYVTMQFPHPRQYYERNSYCYPTSSQGRLMMLSKGRKHMNLSPRLLNKQKHIAVERDLDTQQNIITKMKGNKIYPTILTDTDIHYDTQSVGTEEQNDGFKKEHLLKSILNKQTYYKITMKEKMLQTDAQMEMPGEDIRQKLDVLLKSVKSVLLEIREQKEQKAIKHILTKSRSTLCTLKELSELALSRIESQYRFKRDNDILYTAIPQNNKITETEMDNNTLQFKEVDENKIGQIIEEEKEKSDKIRKDLEELLQMKCNRQCSANTEFDIPTREMSTVAVNSIIRKESCEVFFPCSLQRKNSLLRSQNRQDKQITIAVNTEPLSLCALMEVSAKTIKHMLAYILNLNYDSYLSALQQQRHSCIARYMCNICRETFSSPSQLSNHIEHHYFGKGNCCVCRHILSLKKSRIGLFNCKYCGQVFTRAYCCDLHQRACAKLYGRVHDIQSNLMILR